MPERKTFCVIEPWLSAQIITLVVPFSRVIFKPEIVPSLYYKMLRITLSITGTNELSLTEPFYIHIAYPWYCNISQRTIYSTRVQWDWLVIIKINTVHYFTDEFLAPGSDHHASSSSGSGHRHEPASQRMTNEDFRKLMMTPRGGSGGSTSVGATPTLGSGMMATPVRGGGASGAAPRPAQKVSSNNEKAENRKKKKSYYAKLKKEEDDQLALLAAKYRDRAKERREGGVGVGGVVGAEEGTIEGTMAPVNDEIASSTSGYRAVGPDFKSSFDAAEARRQKIHESKFLGGDMEHTHLVKGNGIERIMERLWLECLAEWLSS